MDLFTPVADQYAAFARQARHDSACFSSWADQVAADPELCAWIATLPAIKQQPNLVFAAARWHGVPAPGPYDALRTALLEDSGPIRATIESRSTQTNEVGRLAVLTPALAQLGAEPAALLEVGASAGLCLYPDRYGYDWGGHRLAAPPGAPTLRCTTSGPTPRPAHLPRLAWRGGLDLNPLDVTDADAMAWLENLVWPEQEHRRLRLRAAIEIARADPPRLRTGNLLTDLDAAIDEAAAHGPVVVYHCAVVVYCTPEERAEFSAAMRARVQSGRCRWISYEGSGVISGLDATPPHPHHFALALDGRQVAWAHAHGRTLDWLG
ncbi:DUF2332 domain-containing protein [Nocardioides limicola]|uniref:DUF2332 domain-containing protein n=1 Tax=Nocardioides limicola TaxID=2803368 RepID=UPI00193BA3A1|nr:DUF2332 domain-containing protein [Nocardioides sp. DJM-14]